MSEDSCSSDTGSLQEAGIFDGLTAWFSRSVKKQHQKAWTDEDGEITSLDSAMFIFSEDAASSDTARIYESEPYLMDNLAVFHASYIDDCLRQNDKLRNISLGRYFLPPTEVQMLLKGTNPDKTTQNNEGRTTIDSPPKQSKSTVMDSPGIKCRSQCGENNDLAIDHTVDSDFDNPVDCDVTSRPSVTPVERNLVKTTQGEVRNVLNCPPTQNKTPVVELSAYIPLDFLTPTSSDLEEFTLNQNGCSVRLRSSTCAR